MVKANEIRVGNWVRFGEKCEGVVTEIMASGCTYDCDHHICGHQEWSLISPIPLTPEILEQCGFECAPNSRVFKLPIAYQDEYSPCTLQRTADGIQVCRSGIGAITSHIEYLHQLQNLYFALTGEELVYQPIKTQ